jgi:Cft2 family RNA processing exonuclease
VGKRLQVQNVVDSNDRRILIDGLFQGVKYQGLNWQPVSPSLQYVFYIVGHLDHCGWLPWLIKDFQVNLL